MITCDQSDYLEIACLYRIPIALNWPDGRRVEGIPLDTGYNEQREECLLMRRGEDQEWEIGRATSELQSRPHLVCRLLLEKKNAGTLSNHSGCRPIARMNLYHITFN